MNQPGNQASPESIKAHRDARIVECKELRAAIKPLIERLKASQHRSAERKLAMRSLQQAKHWLGEDLQECGTEYPYPNSHNPANTIVDPPSA